MATYGRRNIRSNKAVQQCFAQSSSPAQPSPERQAEKHRAAHRTPQSIDRSQDVNAILQSLKSFNISDSDESPIGPGDRRRRQQDGPAARRPLQETSHNVEVTVAINVKAPRESSDDNDSLHLQTPQSQRRPGLRERHLEAPTTLPSSQSRGGVPRNQASPKQSAIEHLSLEQTSRSRGQTVRPAAQSPSASPPLTECPAYLVKHARPLLDLCVDHAARQAPLPFAAWSSSLSSHFTITKLAEASYGEVYRLSLLPSRCGANSTPKIRESVLKMIALKPPPSSVRHLTKAQKSRLGNMSPIDGVVSELALLKHMSSVPGFTCFRDARVLYGRVPTAFVKAWRIYNHSLNSRGKRSEFPDPGRKTAYSDEQLWAVIEMEDAGADLENVILKDVWGVWDAFWGVAMSLAKGELAAEFEHRDLHLGNVCVTGIGVDGRADKDTVLRQLKGDRTVGLTGLETTIIDYTLSRARITELDLLDAQNDVAFLDLSKDAAIFEGNGEDDYQYDIYRFMRSAVCSGDPTAEYQPSPPRRGTKKAGVPRNQEAGEQTHWRAYTPLTNVVWLHFVLFKLCEHIDWPSDKRSKALDEDGLILENHAAVLEHRLHELSSLLALDNMIESDCRSATDLVSWAVDEARWISEDEVLSTT